MLHLKNIEYQYSDTNSFTIQDINIELANTKITCLLGKNGSGKTTIFRLISGLEKIRHGEIKLNQTLLNKSNYMLAASKRQIAFVSQAQTLFPHLTVKRNLLFANDNSIKLNDLCIRYKIDELLNSYPEELSGGQKQLILLLRVFLQNPQLIILDEAFRQLDKKIKYQIYEELKQFQIEKSIPIFFSTHDINDALSFANRLIILKDGKIIANNCCESIVRTPRTPEIAEFFGTLLYFDTYREKTGVLYSLKDQEGYKNFGVFTRNIELTDANKSPLEAIIKTKHFHTKGFAYHVEFASQKFSIVTKQNFKINSRISLLIHAHDIMSFK